MVDGVYFGEFVLGVVAYFDGEGHDVVVDFAVLDLEFEVDAGFGAEGARNLEGD